jgi:hypothetical protein
VKVGVLVALVLASFVGGIAAVIVMDRAMPVARADSDHYVEFDTTYQHCTEVRSGYGGVSPVALSCTPK